MASLTGVHYDRLDQLDLATFCHSCEYPIDELDDSCPGCDLELDDSYWSDWLDRRGPEGLHVLGYDDLTLPEMYANEDWEGGADCASCENMGTTSCPILLDFLSEAPDELYTTLDIPIRCDYYSMLQTYADA